MSNRIVNYKLYIINFLPYLILALAVGFNLYFLFPELKILADLNDNVFAFALIRRAYDLVQNCSLLAPRSLSEVGFNVQCSLSLLDHWVSYWAMGYPLPHFYQHWPSILVVVLSRVFSPITGASLFDVFNLVKYLLYAAFPLAIYYSARKFDFPPLAAAFSAFLANLIATNYQYGTDYGAVIWRGSGMHTQLWGMVMLPLAISTIYSALKDCSNSSHPEPLDFSQGKLREGSSPTKWDVKRSLWSLDLSRTKSRDSSPRLTRLRMTIRNLQLGNLVIPIIFLTLSFHAHLLFGYVAILSSLFLPFLFALQTSLKNKLKAGGAREDRLSNFAKLHFLSADDFGRTQALFRKQNLKLSQNFGRLADLPTSMRSYFIALLPYLFHLLLIYFFTFLLLSYWLIPLMLNNDLHAKSVWDDYWKFNSFGAREVINRWVSGEIFDYGRFPAMTILVLIGFFTSLLTFLNNLISPKFPIVNYLPRAESRGKFYIIHYLFFPLMLVFWTLMYFGRNTWGGLIDLLPLSEGIHMHRFINGIHFAGIFLAGFGLYWLSFSLISLISLISLKIPKLPNLLMKFIIVITVIIVIFVPLRERTDFLSYNTYLVNHANNAFLTDMKDFQPILDRLQILVSQKPGRIWAGRPGNWGREFKVGMVSVFLTMSVRGFDTLGFEPESWSPNTDFEQFFDESRLDHYNLFNIRYIIAPAPSVAPNEALLSRAKWGEVGPTPYTPPTFAKKELESGKYTLYTVETNGNFEAIAVPYLLKTNKEALLNFVHSWIWSKWPENNNHFLVSYGRPPVNIPPITPIPPITLNSLDWSNYQVLGKDYNLLSYNPFDGTPSATAKVKFFDEKVTLDSFSVKIDTPTETLVMLKATFHPYWQAKVTPANSDQFKVQSSKFKVTKYMVSPAFMAVKAPKGIHEISFTYKMALYKKILTAISLMTLIGLLSLTTIQRKKRE